MSSAPSATAGSTLDALANEHGFGAATLDFVFLDHDKNAYLNDLQSILDRGWLHPGSIVVADNVRMPGAPKYRAYMREQQGKLWNTVEHKTHVEYQTLVVRPGAGVGVPGLSLGATRYRARGWAPAHTSRSACTVTSV